MIYRLLTATAFVFVTNTAQAQSIENFLDNIFKPNRQVQREIIQPTKRELKRQARHSAHSGGTVLATWYKSGQRTANGERFNPHGLTAAHKSLPFGTRVQVTGKSGRSVIVRINDRGPFRRGYSYDLSMGAARAIGHTGSGPIHATVLN